MAAPISVGVSTSAAATSGAQFGNVSFNPGGGSNTSMATAPGAVASATSSPKVWLLLLIPGGILLLGIVLLFALRKKRR